MPINPPRLKFGVENSTPSVLTPGNLRVQLNAIKLGCEKTLEPALAKYIADGMAQIPSGKSFLVAILSPKASVEARAAALSAVAGSPVKSVNDIAYADNTIKLKSHNGKVQEYYLEQVTGSYKFPQMADMPRIMNTADKSNWHPSYLFFEKLATIMNFDNFDKLRNENFRNFKDRSGDETNAEVIQKTDEDTVKQLLGDLVIRSSSRVLQGLTKPDVMPLLISRLGPIDTGASEFYIPKKDTKDELITVWVNNPKPDGEVDAVGVVHNQWYIYGNNDAGSDDKKHGRSPVHTTNFDVRVCSTIYTDDQFITDDYNHVKV